MKKRTFSTRGLTFLLVGLLGLFAATSCFEDTSCGQNTESGMLFQAFKVTFVDDDTIYTTFKADSSFSYINYDTTGYDYLYDTIPQGDTVVIVIEDSVPNISIDSIYTYTLDSTITKIIEADTLYTNRTDSFQVLSGGQVVYPREIDTLSLLPLSLSDTATNLTFVLSDSLSQTVQFWHSLPEAGFLDMDCGFAPVYELYGGKHVSGDSYILGINIANPEVNTDVLKTNILIFY